MAEGKAKESSLASHLNAEWDCSPEEEVLVIGNIKIPRVLFDRRVAQIRLRDSQLMCLEGRVLHELIWGTNSVRRVVWIEQKC
jgi:hypothetical protein